MRPLLNVASARSSLIQIFCGLHCLSVKVNGKDKEHVEAWTIISTRIYLIHICCGLPDRRSRLITQMLSDCLYKNKRNYFEVSDNAYSNSI